MKMEKQIKKKKQPKTKLFYDKLWELLKSKNILKKTLKEKTEMSGSTLAKLNRGENVNTDILLLICEVLECGVGDICEIIEKEKSK
jgi:DNA-binding Xre family transcriptional regulator